MSTPMFEVPEHFRIPVTKDGQGPAEQWEAAGCQCWCKDGADCKVVTAASFEEWAAATAAVDREARKAMFKGETSG